MANSSQPLATESAARYLNLFRPRLDRYGWSKPLYDGHGRPQMKNKGKDGQKHVWESKAGKPAHAIVEKFPTITADLIDHHLHTILAPVRDLSNVTIGATPLRTDGTVRWLCIDVDTYTGGHRALRQKVRDIELPLVAARSKSGGLHLFLFFDEDVKAGDAREVGKRYLQLLGLPKKTEIFPKQEDAEFGGWLNLPYAGGGERYGWDADGNVLKAVDDWLTFAESRRVTLAAARAAGDRQLMFEDGPPCLATIHGTERFDDFRNNLLFNVGVYLRLKHPEEWQGLLEEYDADFVQYDDDTVDVTDIIASLEKKPDYFYQCTDQPLCDHCEKPVCLSRLYGVGENKLTFAQLQEKLADPAVFADGGWRELCHQTKFDSQTQFDSIAELVKDSLRKAGQKVRIASIRGDMLPPRDAEDEEPDTHHRWAKAFLAVLNDPVGVEGKLWTPDKNIWIPREESRDVVDIAENFDGAETCKRRGDYKAISQQAYDIAEDRDFFSKAPVGVATPSGLWTIEGGKLVNIPLSLDHRKRYILPVDPDDIRPVLFDRFLADSFRGADPENQILRMWELLGAIVTGTLYEYERVALLLGKGGAGKSTLLRIIKLLVPKELRAAVSPDMWDNPYYVAALGGMMFNECGDMRDKPIPMIFKQIVGRDTVSGRQPYGRVFSFEVTAGNVFNANAYPLTKDYSSAFWRRWEAWRFPNVVPKEKRIRDLDKQLEKELPAILYHALLGAARLAQQNDFTRSVEHDLLMSDWRRGADAVESFLYDDEWVELDPTVAESVDDVWTAFRRWLSLERRKELGRNTFKHRLEELGFKQGRSNNGKVRLWKGFRLTAKWKTDY